jgi:hypothetical protein
MGSVRRAPAVPPVDGAGQATPVPTDPEWLTYLCEVCKLLWPPPAAVTVHGQSGPRRAGYSGRPQRGSRALEDSEFILLRWPNRSRLLVPASPRVAAAAVRHYGMPATRAARLGAKALSLALATRVAALPLRGSVRVVAPPGADTIETYLAETFSRELRISMYLGPPRANRKPVLQLLTPAGGEPVAFAKVGVNLLTRNLVKAEHDSLSALDREALTEVIAPRVLHYDEWHGLNVLVLSALPRWTRRRPPSNARLVAAAKGVAHVGGLRRESLTNGPYLSGLQARLAVADEGPERAALLRALDVLSERAGGTVLTYGAWHGDFTPWNMAGTERGLLLWDWERFSLGVPLGFDLLHHWLQDQVGLRHREPLAAAEDCLKHAAGLLAPIEVAAKDARLTATLYLTDLATRYLVDRQAEAGAPRGSPQSWLIPAILHEVS